jgi:hypothetical protein
MLQLDGDKDRYLPALGKARRYFDPPFFHPRSDNAFRFQPACCSSPCFNDPERQAVANLAFSSKIACAAHKSSFAAQLG